MRINKRIERREVKIGDAMFFVVPFPYDEVRADAAMAATPDFQKQVFMHGLVGWEGLVDDDEKPLEFNDENKLHLFRYEHGLRKEIVRQINLFMVEKAELVKNLLTSQSGKETEAS